MKSFRHRISGWNSRFNRNFICTETNKRDHSIEHNSRRISESVTGSWWSEHIVFFISRIWFHHNKIPVAQTSKFLSFLRVVSIWFIRHIIEIEYSNRRVFIFQKVKFLLGEFTDYFRKVHAFALWQWNEMNSCWNTLIEDYFHLRHSQWQLTRSFTY